MNRVNKILNHDLFKECVAKNEAAEKERQFCRHNMGHFLDVARLAYIFTMQEKLEIPQDILYTAALLHDIGRFKQYEDGTPHELASAELAPKILTDCGYTETERKEILSAIRTHRDKTVRDEKNLNGILYRADKMSRGCFACKMEAACDWKADKKNLTLSY